MFTEESEGRERGQNEGGNEERGGWVLGFIALSTVGLFITV